MAYDAKKIIRVVKGPTNWFFVILVFLAGIGAASLMYIALFTSFLEIDSLEITNAFKKSPVTLSLVTEKKEIALGETFDAAIFLDTGKKRTAGVDILLYYDPIALALQKGGDTDEYLNTEFSSFDIFQYTKINTAKGAIFLSALAKPLREVEGRGEVAALSFMAIRQGTTTIVFGYEKNSNTDSNVAYQGKDILTNTYGVELVVK